MLAASSLSLPLFVSLCLFLLLQFCIYSHPLQLEIFFACAAARPHDDKGSIIESSAPIYLLFSEKNEIFQSEIFGTELFKSFAQKVHDAEEVCLNVSGGIYQPNPC